MSTDSPQATEWITYDELTGPELDDALWQPADFGTGPRLEPGAQTTVNAGELRVEIGRFENRHDSDQGLDNTKHLLLSTRAFGLPAGAVARFAVALRSGVRDASGDYRHGFASVTLVDLTGATNRVFAVLSTGERVFAEEERLPGHETLAPFTRIVEDPFLFARHGTRPDGEFVRAMIEVDRSRGSVAFRVDGELLHVAAGLDDLPEEVHLGLGMFTLLPIGEGGGSAHGQGGSVTWRDVRYSATG